MKESYSSKFLNKLQEHILVPDHNEYEALLGGFYINSEDINAPTLLRKFTKKPTLLKKMTLPTEIHSEN